MPTSRNEWLEINNMMNPRNQRMHLLVALIVACPGLSFACPQDEKVRAKGITVTEPELGDLYSLLHVQKYSGTFALQGNVSEVGLRIDFYKNGRKTSESFTGGWDAVSEPRPRSGRCSIQVADLDYLPLAGGKKGTLRFYVALTMVDKGTSTISWEHDIPKAVFDPSRSMRGGGTFSGEALEKGEIPLFWRLTQDGNHAGTGNSPDEVLKENPVADIMIAYLLFK